MELKINDQYYDIYLAKTKRGIDLCINSSESRNYILNLTVKGEILLYADIDRNLKRNGRYINVRREDEI